MLFSIYNNMFYTAIHDLSSYPSVRPKTTINKKLHIQTLHLVFSQKLLLFFNTKSSSIFSSVYYCKSLRVPISIASLLRFVIVIKISIIHLEFITKSLSSALIYTCILLKTIIFWSLISTMVGPEIMDLSLLLI